MEDEVKDEEFTQEELDLLDLMARMIVSSVINKHKAQPPEPPQQKQKTKRKSNAEFKESPIPKDEGSRTP